MGEIGNKTAYWAGRSVLITGHEGFLGAALTKTLVERGCRVVGLDKVQNRKLSLLNEGNLRSQFTGVRGNVSSLKLMKDLIDKYQPQTVFHLAAEAIVGKALLDPVANFKSNIQGTWNVLEAVRGKPFVESVVVASSDKAYGSHEKLPYTEDAPLIGEHPYDVSKSCADLICRSYFLTYGTPVCVTRCGNIYGPGDHNFSRLVPDAIRHVLTNRSFPIRSNGKFTRDYIFVEDIVNAYLLLAERMVDAALHGEAFNFSCEDPKSVLEIFQSVSDACGRPDARSVILNQGEHEIQHQFLSSVKAREALGWEPRHQLAQSLATTASWYKGHLES